MMAKRADAEMVEHGQRVRHFLVGPVGGGVGPAALPAAAEVERRSRGASATRRGAMVSKSLALRVRPGRQTAGVRPPAAA